MGFKRLMKKTCFGQAPVVGHLLDAVEKQRKTGGKFSECLSESVKETIQEDMPGTSHIYQQGKKDGRVQGTIEQAKRDEKKFIEQAEQFDCDRRKWETEKEKYEDLLDEIQSDYEEREK